MSGAGPGAGRAISESGPGMPDDARCDQLRFSTNLASPDEDVLTTLDVGAVLTVGLERMPMGDAPRVVASVGESAAGAIVTRLQTLIRCLQEGYSFSATVQYIDDGIVRVEVHPA